jgi:GDP-4-dehydro-6-deoxy-D-mannose reductase
VPKLLVTGHSGFVGRSLLEMVARGEAGAGYELVALPETIDLRSPDFRNAVAACAPDAVLHLAALSSVGESFRDFDNYFAVNFHGTLNLLRALEASGFRGRMVYVGSGDCYGAVPEAELPIGEDRPLRPRNPYAVSKVAAEALCYQWSQTAQMDIVIARPFNHIGRGQDTRFAVAAFASQVARIAAGGAEPRIVTGDLSVTRDFTDVRDVINAYFALLAGGRRGEAYNIGSGRETRLSQVLESLLSLAGVRASVETDPVRLRADEHRRVVADVRKIRDDTGWTATTPLDATLRDVLDDWTERIRHG